MVKIKVENISKWYGDYHTLSDVSLEVEENQFVSIIGPSGCGKSTLFNIIAGLEKPDEGSFTIDGKNYVGSPGRVSYMYQKDLLLPWKNLVDNVMLPLIIKGIPKKQASEMVIEKLSLFGLAGFENHYPFELSGGMRQRAALLRTYLFSNDIWLLDEPFAGLDAITKRSMQSCLLEICTKLKASVLFITHDIDEAIFLSDKIYIFSERPARVKKIYDVALERPRGKDVYLNAEFNRMKNEILEIL